MPVLENIEAMTVNTSPAPVADMDDPHQAQPVREITQTDHLNKRLLKSLLDSMKSNATDAQENSTPTEANNDNNNDFDD
ncbi:uncharacterized protein LOC117568808 [Drosophila albomicans]|uniref:Uncharacterized protein LOC117568808 n=1 Tax=Drosophila albomicans TaxID=7291 RepID=A0A6P8X315_DROAB|nr:uncharacterized protein LOC117568808 [Drosophila albomicans]